MAKSTLFLCRTPHGQMDHIRSVPGEPITLCGRHKAHLVGPPWSPDLWFSREVCERCYFSRKIRKRALLADLEQEEKPDVS